MMFHPYESTCKSIYMKQLAELSIRSRCMRKIKISMYNCFFLSAFATTEGSVGFWRILGEFTNQVQTCPFNERKGRKRRENSGLVPKEQRKAERCVARASTRLAFRTSPSAARIGRTACAIDC